MSKVRYANDVEDRPAQQEAAAECERADNAVRELRAVKSRVAQFFDAIDYAVFPDVETAPAWAENPLAFILDGTVPEPPVEVVDEEADDATPEEEQAGEAAPDVGDAPVDDLSSQA